MSQMPSDFLYKLPNYEMPKSKVTPIQTKYVITKDKSIKNNQLVGVDLKKGDIIQGISITTSGDMTNDSGTKSLKFTDKNNNVFSLQIGYRGFEPFFEEMYQPAPITEAVKQQNLKIGDTLTAEDKFYEKLGIKYHNTHMFGRPSRTKGRLLVALALVAGYFAYKKFKK